MDRSSLKHFYSLQEAKHSALFKSFASRVRGDEFVVIPSYKNQYTVILKADALEGDFDFIEVKNENFSCYGDYRY